MIPDTQAPPVQHDFGHGDLINAVYHAIRIHPNPVKMSLYAKMLSSLLDSQAKDHTAGSTTGAAPTQGTSLIPPGAADNANPAGGYVAQNVSPIQQALIAHGGLQNQNPNLFHGGFTNTGEDGLLGAVMAAHRVPLPPWAMA